jgi:UDP:flavonoid glycosyltransferase YjiC (YdhE family)
VSTIVFVEMPAFGHLNPSLPLARELVRRGDSNALWGHIVVRSLRLPSVSLMTTILIGSAEFRRLRIREWLHMLRPMLPSLVPIAVARSRLLRQYDASVVPRPAFPALGGLNLAMYPRDFQPPNPRLDATFRFVGPMIDPDTRLGASFELSGPEPLVYMSLGTLHRATTAFYRQCLGHGSAGDGIAPGDTRAWHQGGSDKTVARQVAPAVAHLVAR